VGGHAKPISAYSHAVGVTLNQSTFDTAKLVSDLSHPGPALSNRVYDFCFLLFLPLSTLCKTLLDLMCFGLEREKERMRREDSKVHKLSFLQFVFGLSGNKQFDFPISFTWCL
jgi:hypothetical protein